MVTLSNTSQIRTTIKELSSEKETLKTKKHSQTLIYNKITQRVVESANLELGVVAHVCNYTGEASGGETGRPPVNQGQPKLWSQDTASETRSLVEVTGSKVQDGPQASLGFIKPHLKKQQKVQPLSGV